MLPPCTLAASPFFEKESGSNSCSVSVILENSPFCEVACFFVASSPNTGITGGVFKEFHAICLFHFFQTLQTVDLGIEHGSDGMYF